MSSNESSRRTIREMALMPARDREESLSMD
jgi:hypothetical protein